MAELGKATLRVSVDEVNMLRRLCSAGIRSRQTAGKECSAIVNNPAATEEEKTHARTRFQQMGREVLLIEAIQRGLGGEA